jgi:putative tryptophan/tyrosine transport system substrate-binding protein
MPKLLELLLELLPKGRAIALLVNPDIPEAERVIGALQAASLASRVELHILKARTESEVDGAFITLVQTRADGLVSDGNFRPRIAALALRHGVPTIARQRDFAFDGGLLSYGPSLTDAYRLRGIYTGRVLKGEKPADLPVQQPSKLEMVVNLKTAKALGLTVPPLLLARADEIIE